MGGRREGDATQGKSKDPKEARQPAAKPWQAMGKPAKGPIGDHCTYSLAVRSTDQLTILYSHPSSSSPLTSLSLSSCIAHNTRSQLHISPSSHSSQSHLTSFPLYLHCPSLSQTRQQSSAIPPSTSSTHSIPRLHGVPPLHHEPHSSSSCRTTSRQRRTTRRDGAHNTHNTRGAVSTHPHPDTRHANRPSFPVATTRQAPTRPLAQTRS